MSETQPEMTLDQKRDTMALIKAILTRDVDGAKAIMANASFSEHMAIAVCLKLADAIHPADTQQMIIEADRALAWLATES
jgi:hypothetical protein